MPAAGRLLYEDRTRQLDQTFHLAARDMLDSTGSSRRRTKPTIYPPDGTLETWLAAIVESSDDAIIGKTLDGTIRSWNRGAERMFGYQPSEIIGRSVLTLIPPDLQHEEPQIVSRLAEGKRVDHYETVRLRRDGSRIDVSLSVSPIRDRAGSVTGAAKIARDITEAKRLQQAEHENSLQLHELAIELEQQVEEAQTLQEELEQTNEELSRALQDAGRARQQAENANAAKSQFLATMSHELRTPLNAIAGYIDLLEMGLRGPLSTAQQSDLGRIKHSQQTLLRLIEDVLSFAKLESGHVDYRFEEVLLDDFLNSLDTFIGPRLGQKKLAYRVEPCGSEATVWIDPAKAQQIVLNLLSNAIKFTDHGEIVVRCVLGRTHVRILIQDTGSGIDPDHLESIFEPFVQGNRSLTHIVEGTGLGLSISRQLARAMGGEISVESTVGVGSIFTLLLPCAAR
jgi:PAS domain S-box-containing protein